ncbi:MAG: hypothetical protein A2604_03125 [Candidatus Liptonbacteria bacterium RIFOXYD1_FULL_36_11]|uniref:Mur ligase central domain-containing protein n=1 Tax=Candidatus Liptonbacteria bacterium RIFOXYD1_FULL_36_11 TaxID=1798656 RepID=A0A1G2CRB0_9BACT|nr:MAG: hypothetical protein A2604_03125 [Candidatus Liptonbacteria bacterium RIFOXYD1_FULL_36_11]
MKDKKNTPFFWFCLKFLARFILKRHNPIIIAIVGGAGKTLTKLAICAALKNTKIPRASISDSNISNKEASVLAILGSWDKTGGPFFFLKVIFLSFFHLIFKSKNYPQILILEFGAENQGEIKELIKIAKPSLVVMTAIGNIPPHSESFSTAEAAIREKAKILEHLSSSGCAVLNFDDPAILPMEERTKAEIITFGFKKGSDIRLSNFSLREEDEKPIGISFKLNNYSSSVPIRLDDIFGKSAAYASAAAAAVALRFNSNLVKVSQNLSSNFSTPERCLKLLPGIKETFIIDDTCGSSPVSIKEALDVLKNLPAKRKIAVLGDMLNLGRYTIDAHEEAGNLAANSANFLITIGARSKFTAAAAIKKMPKSKVFSFDSVEEAGKKVQAIIKKGDLILIKASEEIHAEKVVEEIKQTPVSNI